MLSLCQWKDFGIVDSSVFLCILRWFYIKIENEWLDNFCIITVLNMIKYCLKYTCWFFSQIKDHILNQMVVIFNYAMSLN